MIQQACAVQKERGDQGGRQHMAPLPRTLHPMSGTSSASGVEIVKTTRRYKPIYHAGAWLWQLPETIRLINRTACEATHIVSLILTSGQGPQQTGLYGNWNDQEKHPSIRSQIEREILE